MYSTGPGRVQTSNKTAKSSRWSGRCLKILKKAYEIGWKKMHQHANGVCRKTWTRTIILSPNICYFVAILRFVAIYALCGILCRKAAKFCYPAELLESVETVENVEMMELGKINVPFNGAVARRGNLSPLLSVGKLENRNRNIALENKRKPLKIKQKRGGKCDKNGEGS